MTNEKKIYLVIVFLLGTLNVAAQRDYSIFTLADFRSDTLHMDGYSYVCDTLRGFRVYLFNLESNGVDIKNTYKDGTPLPLNPWDMKDQVVIDENIATKTLDILNDSFSNEQRGFINGDRLDIVVNVSSNTGEITDVYFSFSAKSKYTVIPVSVFRNMETRLKNEVVFELTEEGRSLTFCSIMWWEKPMADDETIHTPNLPFDGGGGSGGEGNVQTGPRGSIITEPMVPPK
ncbi:MAG: DUF5043 domain-containing protein [Tidjanibacter sp.]|nr:DUF5043 domain-containing protein [Tidjanibacter sp.]